MQTFSEKREKVDDLIDNYFENVIDITEDGLEIEKVPKNQEFSKLAMGIEPTTSSLRVMCSTIEPRQHN